MSKGPWGRVEMACAEVQRHMREIKALFVEDARITVLVRLPGDPDADIVVTADSMDEVIKALQHRAAQESWASHPTVRVD